MKEKLKRAAELLRREAQILRECNPNTTESGRRGGEWNGNDAARQDHDELLAAAVDVDKAIVLIAELERGIGRAGDKAYVLSSEVFDAIKAQDEHQKARIAELEARAVPEVCK